MESSSFHKVIKNTITKSFFIFRRQTLSTSSSHYKLSHFFTLSLMPKKSIIFFSQHIGHAIMHINPLCSCLTTYNSQTCWSERCRRKQSLSTGAAGMVVVFLSCMFNVSLLLSSEAVATRPEP